jgi:hypothetical protein
MGCNMIGKGGRALPRSITPAIGIIVGLTGDERANNGFVRHQTELILRIRQIPYCLILHGFGRYHIDSFCSLTGSADTILTSFCSLTDSADTVLSSFCTLTDSADTVLSSFCGFQIPYGFGRYRIELILLPYGFGRYRIELILPPYGFGKCVCSVLLLGAGRIALIFCFEQVSAIFSYHTYS